MLRIVALVPLAGVLWMQPAEACSCMPQNVIVHPTGPNIPAQDGLIGHLVFTGTPTISVSYADDPARAQIAGNFRWLLTGTRTLWTFTPSAPLIVGRTVRAEVTPVAGSSAPTAAGDFTVISSTIAPPPTFPGITGLQAIVSRFQNPVGGTCDLGPVQSRMVLDGITIPSAGAPLYRYFFYERGAAVPLEPSTYGVAGHFISHVRCGDPMLRCAPDLPMNLEVGEEWCVRVEAMDLMGHRSGYDAEACATVVGEDVEVVDFGGMVSCNPSTSAPDAGVAADDTGAGPPAPAPDASAHADAAIATAGDAGAAADALSAIDSGEEADGCSCVTPRRDDPRLAWSSVLAAAWAWRRRRRASTPRGRG